MINTKLVISLLILPWCFQISSIKRHQVNKWAFPLFLWIAYKLLPNLGYTRLSHWFSNTKHLCIIYCLFILFIKYACLKCCHFLTSSFSLWNLLILSLTHFRINIWRIILLGQVRCHILVQRSFVARVGRVHIPFCLKVWILGLGFI